jgi:hypothetical protein
MPNHLDTFLYYTPSLPDILYALSLMYWWESWAFNTKLKNCSLTTQKEIAWCWVWIIFYSKVLVSSKDREKMCVRACACVCVIYIYIYSTEFSTTGLSPGKEHRKPEGGKISQWWICVKFGHKSQSWNIIGKIVIIEVAWNLNFQNFSCIM